MRMRAGRSLVSILIFVLAVSLWLSTPVMAADMKVARSDDAAERVFLLYDAKAGMTNELFIANVKAARAWVAKNKAGWSVNWSIGFFNDPKFAYLKEDPKVKQFVADKSWQNGFVAEYLNATKTLVFFPVDPSMREEIKVD